MCFLFKKKQTMKKSGFLFYKYSLHTEYQRDVNFKHFKLLSSMIVLAAAFGRKKLNNTLRKMFGETTVVFNHWQ